MAHIAYCTATSMSQANTIVDRLKASGVTNEHISVVMADNDDIAGVRTRDNGAIEGDLFIDCTGHAALLIEGRFGVPFVDRSTRPVPTTRQRVIGSGDAISMIADCPRANEVSPRA